jgi:hypothetical protein
VQSQKRFDHSLLSWMKRLIRVRKSCAAFGRGTIEFLYPANHRVLAYVRKLGNETILVVNNLSNAAQAVELDLKAYRGNILMEMFARNIFHRIGTHLVLTMGRISFIGPVEEGEAKRSVYQSGLVIVESCPLFRFMRGKPAASYQLLAADSGVLKLARNRSFLESILRCLYPRHQRWPGWTSVAVPTYVHGETCGQASVRAGCRITSAARGSYQRRRRIKTAPRTWSADDQRREYSVRRARLRTPQYQHAT